MKYSDMCWHDWHYGWRTPIGSEPQSRKCIKCHTVQWYDSTARRIEWGQWVDRCPVKRKRSALNPRAAKGKK